MIIQLHAKLWYFWTNHFTISDTQRLPEFVTGAYHREFIRANMDKTFETMASRGNCCLADDNAS